MEVNDMIIFLIHFHQGRSADPHVDRRDSNRTVY